jgi:hypothetical protein
VRLQQAAAAVASSRPFVAHADRTITLFGSHNGRYADGTKLAAGNSPAFRLIVLSQPEEH